MLYGTAAEGGSSYNGTVFGVATDGTGFTTVHDFCDASYGELPVASLILSGNTLFGTTAYGGKANGTVFKVDTNGAGFVVLHSFTGMNDLTNSDGANPTAALILSRNTLYGTTAAGGSSGNGVVFKLNTDGTGFATLHSFAALNGTTNRDGASPLAGLTLLGDALYGTAAAAVLRAVARFSP